MICSASPIVERWATVDDTTVACLCLRFIIFIMFAKVNIKHTREQASTSLGVYDVPTFKLRY